MDKEDRKITREALLAMYGPDVPLQPRLRVETEMDSIKHDTFMDDILLAYDLREAARKDGSGISAGFNDGEITRESSPASLPLHKMQKNDVLP